MAKFFLCKHCKKLIEVINDNSVPTLCCGENMTELKANTVDASGEKHLPVVVIEGNTVTVSVGSVAHPMLPEHFITWVALETNEGILRKPLTPGSEPVAKFALTENEKAVAAYEYCNLHGLWKTEL